MKTNLTKLLSLAVLLGVATLGGCNLGVTTETTPIVNTPQESTTQGEPLEVATDTNDTQFLNTDDGVAIKGADPVAYFLEGEAVLGSSDFSYDWNGATWHFASAANRDLFAENPTQYAPQYGGHCAWAVSQGNVADIDPEAWSIVDGRLYLNYDKSIQQKWQKDIPGHITQANDNWPGLVQSNS